MNRHHGSRAYERNTDRIVTAALVFAILAGACFYFAALTN